MKFTNQQVKIYRMTSVNQTFHINRQEHFVETTDPHNVKNQAWGITFVQTVYIVRNTVMSSKGLMSCPVIRLCCKSIRVDFHSISPETLDLPCRPKDPAPLDSILALTLYPGSSPAKHKSLPAQGSLTKPKAGLSLRQM